MSLPLENIEYFHIVKYTKRVNNTYKDLLGVKLRPGYYHEYVSYNNFSLKEKKIPIGFRKVKLSAEYIKEFVFDKTKTLLSHDNLIYEEIKSTHKGQKTYFTHDNGGRPFLVYVNEKDNEVDIYKIPKSTHYIEPDYGNIKNYFIQLVASYKTLEVFVGKSSLNPMTQFSGSHGDNFDGNSILLKLRNNRYVFIGTEIYEFTTDDEIKIYHSPVGNSDVAYPFAIGEENVYFMLDYSYVTRKDFDCNLPSNITDAYSYFYGNIGNCNFKNKTTKFQDFEIINKRI